MPLAVPTYVVHEKISTCLFTAHLPSEHLTPRRISNNALWLIMFLAQTIAILGISAFFLSFNFANRCTTCLPVSLIIRSPIFAYSHSSSISLSPVRHFLVIELFADLAFALSLSKEHKINYIFIKFVTS